MARWNRFRVITTPTMTALHASLGPCMARRKTTTTTTTSGRREDPSLPEPIRQRIGTPGHDKYYSSIRRSCRSALPLHTSRHLYRLCDPATQVRMLLPSFNNNHRVSLKIPLNERIRMDANSTGVGSVQYLYHGGRQGSSLFRRARQYVVSGCYNRTTGRPSGATATLARDRPSVALWRVTGCRFSI